MSKRLSVVIAEDNPRCNYFWQQDRVKNGRIVITASGCARTAAAVKRAVLKRGAVIVYARLGKSKSLREAYYFKDGKRQRF